MPDPRVLSCNDREITKSLRVSTLRAFFANLHVLSIGPVDNFYGGRIAALNTANLNRVIISFSATLWT
ncbi:MAG TPA: hypothetical protein VED24_00010 [Candidatus Acidoferrum sp.]|nr:hypothetical protein [Candidatus Acidoferrum sp.]